MNTITINNEEYVKKSDIQSFEKAKDLDGLPYVIIRTYSAGVFAGYLKEKKDNEVVLLNARRIWYWSGANSLSELAVHGVTKPLECKFPCEVPEVTLLGVIEILEVSEKARNSINNVPVWKQDEN